MPPTTEPATTEPATTEPATTEPATTEPATTEPATTEPATTEPATTAPDTTTGDTGGEGNSSTPTSDAGSGAGLPSTGSDTSSLIVLGLFLTIGGVALTTMTRRRTATR